MQEQRGTAARPTAATTLQKYADYVLDGRDFPLAEFRSRHSAATEAVGYGKTLMVFHMLRRKLGDDRFRAWAAGFYREMRGRKASFADVRRDDGSGSERREDEEPRPLLPRLDRARGRRGAGGRTWSKSPAVDTAGAGFEVRGTLRQTQGGEPFALDVPIAIQTDGASTVDRRA